MGILELENRCTGNRTVGSNPTLSANSSILIYYVFSALASCKLPGDFRDLHADPIRTVVRDSFSAPIDRL